MDVDAKDAAPAMSGPLVALTVFAVLGGFLFGYDTGVVSGAEVFIKEDLNLSDGQVEVVVSITVLFAALGSLVSGPPMQKRGRKPVIMVAACFYAGGSATIAAAPGFGVLVLGRVLLGLGVGLSSMAIPVYVAEAAPPEIRGRLVSFYNLFIVLGQAAACGVNVWAAAALGVSARWRASMGAAAAPALLQLAGVNAMAPEDVGDVRSTLEEIRASPHLRRIFGVGLGLMALQQFSGVNTIMYYGASIMIMCGFEENQSVQLAAALAVAQGLGIVCSLPLWERLGRRRLLVPSTLASATCLLVVAAAFARGISAPANHFAALGGVFCYLLAFGLGLSSGPWVVNSEIYPTRVRGVGNSAACFVNWAANYVVSATFLSACRAFGNAATFAGLAFVGYAGALWIHRSLPETNGLTLEDIEDLFRRRCAESSGGRTRVPTDEPPDDGPLDDRPLA
ncbi:glucose transporter [Aureococcus anophagefferens]|uniref:Hexose transporter 1 n=1 Tax=Aureococcus anophagefferens TaxID=44056 RepID=A0ABR1FH40_AURAN